MATSKGKGSSKPSGHDRSAVTGRYVSSHYATTHPKTTVHESAPKSPKKK